jgi:hypothetical protein
MRRLVALCALVALVSGCSANVTIGGAGGGSPPRCDPRPGDSYGAVALLAQAVPTATLLPCTRTLPAGWTFQQLSARSGRATFWLDSDRDGARAASVSLRRDCDVRGATEVPSERSGTQRHERVIRVGPGYVGDRYYTFSGGCVTYHFNLRGSTRGEPLAHIAQAVDFVSRDTLRQLVREDSDGRLSLDPTVKS